MCRRIATALMLFGCGFVCALQLATLYPNAQYDAAWWKVGLSILVAISWELGRKDTRCAITKAAEESSHAE